MTNLGCFEVDVQIQDDGKLDVYISHEGSSGAHYTDIDAKDAGAYLIDLIECCVEAYSNLTIHP